MQNNIEDCAKMRLTERVDVLTAINILKERGYDVEEILTEMVRLFYVDLDEFNELVNAA
jgi:hypothetical protein